MPFGHARVISFYLYYTCRGHVSVIRLPHTIHLRVILYIKSSLLLFIRAHRTADDTVLLEGRPSDVGANALEADTRADRMWRKKLRWPGVSSALYTAGRLQQYSIPILLTRPHIGYTYTYGLYTWHHWLPVSISKTKNDASIVRGENKLKLLIGRLQKVV